MTNRTTDQINYKLGDSFVFRSFTKNDSLADRPADVYIIEKLRYSHKTDNKSDTRTNIHYTLINNTGFIVKETEILTKIGCKL